MCNACTPGLSKDTDEDGFRTYTRPAGKQGGHGVGWSEIPPYKFKVLSLQLCVYSMFLDKQVQVYFPFPSYSVTTVQTAGI